MLNRIKRIVNIHGFAFIIIREVEVRKYDKHRNNNKITPKTATYSILSVIVIVLELPVNIVISPTKNIIIVEKNDIFSKDSFSILASLFFTFRICLLSFIVSLNSATL